MSLQSKNKIKKIAESIYQKNLNHIETQLGDSTTYSDQLDEFCKDKFGDKFMGVFASDQIPHNINKGQMMIVNLDTSKQSGSHWVSVVKDYKDVLWVYDSFGRNIHKILPKIFGKKRKVKSTEKDPEQLETESNCGARCVSFLEVFNDYGIQYAKYI